MNEGIERAHRDGILSTASLMVTGPAALDAMQRARRMPDLKVGLHLVLVEGDAMLPGAAPHIVDETGRFPTNQVGLGFSYFFLPHVRRQLGMEIAAQFRAFRATGFPLDHANAHKHMHLHPTVGRLMIEIGVEFGLRAIRIPNEPPAAFRAAGGSPGIGGRLLPRWTAILRRQARRAGLVTNDQVFGIGWSGHMTANRLLRLVPHIPAGLTEIYFHPATKHDLRLQKLMPDYEPEAELATLVDPVIRDALLSSGVQITTFSDQHAQHPKTRG